MATLRTLTGNVGDIFGAAVGARNVTAEVTTNIPHPGALLDHTNKVVHLPKGQLQVDDAGDWSIQLPDTSSPDLNVVNLQYRLVLTATLTGAARPVTWDSGFFSLTANRNIADDGLLDTPALTPSWRSAFTAEMETVKTEAVTATGADRTAIAADRAYVEARVVDDLGTTDGQTKALIETPSSETAQALSATYATRRLGLAPGKATLGAVERGTAPTPVESFDGYLWGVGGGNISRSSNGGATWATYCPSPAGDTPLRLIPTDDGEVICALGTSIRKSSGWATGAPTWTTKVAANGQARFLPFQVDGNGTKFIAAQYGPSSTPGSQPYIDSRYAHISVDGGDTWVQVWDSVAKFGATEANASHLHGACYDPWSDRFYLAEGHGATNLAIAGVYVSSDDGATWVRPAGLINQPPPTVMIPTDDGIVCGSDHAQAGVWGIVRQTNAMDEKIIRTWAWTSGIDGVIGFGQRGHRDPETGVVYIGFYSANASVAPIIAGGTAAAGGLAWTWEGANSSASQIHQLAVHQGQLHAYGTFNSVAYILKGTLPGPVSGAPVDTGNAAGGRAGGTSVALGPGATAQGSGLNNLAVGVGATVAGGSSGQTVIGQGASSTATSNTVVGRGASASTGSATVVGTTATAAGESTALGQGATASGAQATALGKTSTASAVYSTVVGVNAKTTGTGSSYGTAVGRGAEVGSQAVAVGAGAKATATSAVAIGYNVEVAHNSSVGFATTTAATQFAIGGRHFEVDVLAAAPGTPSAGKARLYVVDVAGKPTLCIKFSDGAIHALAAMA